MWRQGPLVCRSEFLQEVATMKETKLEQEALQLSPEELADLAAKPSLSLETGL